jgi:hypothetical protein
VFELPDKAALSAIVERYARLLADIGDHVGRRPLVLPDADFFPDRFTGDATSAGRLVERMASHAGLGDVPLTTRVVSEEEPEAPHQGCSSGCAVPVAQAAGTPRLVDHGDGFTLNIAAPELGHPVVLTTMVARALGHVLLVEALPEGAGVEAPLELTADYAAVALGFGPLLLEGAYIYSKSCGGPRVAQVTRAALTEIAVLTALFVEMGGHSARRVTKDLGATQAASLGETLEWARSNRELCARLSAEPARIAAGDYSLRDAKPWLLRVFGRKPKIADDEIPAELLRPRERAPRTPDPRHDELRELVEDALAGSRASADTGRG